MSIMTPRGLGIDAESVRAAGGLLTVRVRSDKRREAREHLGRVQDELPDVPALLQAAARVSELLHDATGGAAQLRVVFPAARPQEDKPPVRVVLAPRTVLTVIERAARRAAQGIG